MSKYDELSLPNIQENINAKAGKIIEVGRGIGDTLMLKLGWMLNNQLAYTLVLVELESFYRFSHLLNSIDYGYYVIHSDGAESWYPTESFETNFIRDDIEKLKNENKELCRVNQENNNEIERLKNENRELRTTIQKHHYLKTIVKSSNADFYLWTALESI